MQQENLVALILDLLLAEDSLSIVSAGAVVQQVLGSQTINDIERREGR